MNYIHLGKEIALVQSYKLSPMYMQVLSLTHDLMDSFGKNYAPCFTSSPSLCTVGELIDASKIRKAHFVHEICKNVKGNFLKISNSRADLRYKD